MELLDLIKKRRSIRKFKNQRVDREDLLNLLEAACFSHSLCNRQRLHFWVITDVQMVDYVFQHSSLGNPQDGEQGLTAHSQAPTSYIVVSVQGASSSADFVDVGSAYQSMALMSVKLNLGLFYVHAFSEQMLTSFLPINEDHSVLSVVAVGQPAENPVAINIEPADLPDYYDLNETHSTIPKLKTKYMVTWC